MFLVSVLGSETLLLCIFSHTTLGGAQMLIGAQRYLEFHDKWVRGEPGFIISAQLERTQYSLIMILSWGVFTERCCCLARLSVQV